MVGVNIADKIKEAYRIDNDATPSPSSEFKLDCRLDAPPNAVKLHINAKQISRRFFKIFLFSALQKTIIA